MHKDDYTNNALHIYNENLITTNIEGYLDIQTVTQDVVVHKKATSSATSSRVYKGGLGEGVIGRMDRGEILTPNNHSIDHKIYNNQQQKTANVQIKHYQSGMLQSWNKFCFTGGIVEIKAKLPGYHDKGGLWPAIWLLGNLARATYVGSSNNIWPWSLPDCHHTNSHQKQQRINACDNVQHFGLNVGQGRGAPEIDILEAMAGKSSYNTRKERNKISDNKNDLQRGRRPYFSSSFQVAPGMRERDHPALGEKPHFERDSNHINDDDDEKHATYSHWYGYSHSDDPIHGLFYGPQTCLNDEFYGMKMKDIGDATGIIEDTAYHTDAISANTNIETDKYDDFHIYRLEWQPRTKYSGDGDTENNEDIDHGFIAWYLDDELIYRIDGEVLHKSGTNAVIPEEPMYIILNTAISSTWGFPKP